MRVYKTFKMRMSKNDMSNVMYGVIMTGAHITSTFGIGIYNYSRSQNTYNNVNVVVEIDDYKIEDFERHSGKTLVDLPKAHVNG